METVDYSYVEVETLARLFCAIWHAVSATVSCIDKPQASNTTSLAYRNSQNSCNSITNQSNFALRPVSSAAFGNVRPHFPSLDAPRMFALCSLHGVSNVFTKMFLQFFW